MRYGNPPADPRALERAEELARTAGRLGAARVPDEALFGDGRDPSDSMLVRAIEALKAGWSERRQS